MGTFSCCNRQGILIANRIVIEVMYLLSKKIRRTDEFCKIIIQEAMGRGTMDNISCFVVKLN